MKRNRILIADDVSLNREMLTEMLGDKYDFTYATNGIEAIDAMRGKDTIDLLLLDLNMPQMDGFEVLRIMNERHWIDECPVIMISAEDSAQFIEQAYKLGVVDYISRPFRTLIVQRRVENTLAMYTNQKRLIHLFGSQVYEKEKINNAMINIFSNIIESRNHESGSHTLNVQTITKLLLHSLIKISDRYSLTESDIALISSLAALHDIGKIKVPDEIINKPGKLTAEEWEIMKSHTTEGDEILANASLDQSSEFVKTARAICRWHHEKYDGKGYPDGLVGDDIPLCAQVVSLADVYDALTSERCYKRAFSHEEAISMILGGECGVFNPLLLSCLQDVQEDLKELKESGNTFDYHDEAAHVADELLTDNDIPRGNALRRMMDNERMKKDFFMSCADGIQFEYDKLLHRVIFVYKKEGEALGKKVVFTSRESPNNVLPLEYWDALTERVKMTTRENPVTEMDVELAYEGKRFPYHAKLMAIWPEDGTGYIFVMGHLTAIE